MNAIHLYPICKYSYKTCIQHIILCFGLLFSFTVYAQFQTSIGNSFPVNEIAIGGLETRSGNLFILADHQNHPSGLFNSLGDLQYLQLNALGNLIHPAKMYGQDGIESASWIEKTICGNGAYIIAGDQNNGTNSNMVVSLIDLSGEPIWTKVIGTATENENSVCIKEDGNGDFILVGNKRNAAGDYSIQLVKLDCSGNQIWNRLYSFGRSIIGTSVTEFATLSSGCSVLPNEYYISGVAVSPIGDDEMLIMSVNVSTGNFSWMNTYDIAPGAAEYATCIQGSCLFNTPQNGELWVSGYSTNTTTNTTQIFFMKTNINGVELWTNNYEIVGDVEVVSHFQFTPAGDMVVTGRAEGLISPPRPATRTGQCLLMKISNSGNQVFWTRIFDQGFASQGNRVEPLLRNEYFITGYTYKADPPSGFDFNMLAIKTDSLGRTSSNCFHTGITDILRRIPVSTRGITTVTSPMDFTSTVLQTKIYRDTQLYCLLTPKPKCDSLFTFLDQLHTLPTVCCYNVFVDNPTANCFSKVQLTLSSGNFNNVTAHSGWTTNVGSNQIEYIHNSNFVPTGSVNPGSFCVSGTTNPYTITVTYHYASGGVSGKCEERFILNCPVVPFPICECPTGSIPGNNMVTNGDFSLGNVGFTSPDYIFVPVIGLQPGRYSIRNSTNLINLSWAGFDHTLPNAPLGNFLVVDGTTIPGTTCWASQANVVLGKEYSFCAFVNNLVNPLNNFTNPVIELWINSTLQATSIALPENPDVWVNLLANWTSNVNGTVSIEIRLGAPVSNSGSGCDFAIDDIAFHECVPDISCDTAACPNNLVMNPGFFQGSALGNLGGPGASNNWTSATQTPQVVNDSCCDPIAILMWGNQDKGESICQSINFQSGHTYSIQFCARFFDQSTLPSKYIQFGLTAANSCISTYNCLSSVCENIGQTGTITNSSWANYSIPNWTATANWSNVIIRAYNNNPDIPGDGTTVSWGMIDDICIEEIFAPDTCCTKCPNNLSWQSVSNQYFIQDMVEYDGHLIIGGSFNVGGFSNIAAWSGTNWLTLGTGLNGVVEALAVHNGELYAGGSFSNQGSNIAKWVGPVVGGSWVAMPGVTGGVNVRVASLLSSNQGLIAGGNFQNVGNNIAVFNGTIWSSLGSGINVPNTLNGSVNALGLFNGLIIAGGVFASPSPNNIAMWSGSTWNAMGSGINLIASNIGQGVKAILQFSPTQLAVGGRFMEAVNGVAVANTNCIAQWDGTQWTSMNTGVNTSFEGLYDMDIHCGDLYVGGLFIQIGNANISGVARWNATTNMWISASSHPDRLVRALQDFKPDSSFSCDLFSGGEIMLNQLACVTENADFSFEQIQIYPNPVESNVWIDLGQIAVTDIQLSLIDIFGKVVSHSNIYKGHHLGMLDMNRLNTGIYLIKLEDRFGVFTYFKVIKN